MSGTPVLRGSIPNDGIVAKLAEVEELRVSGVLTFRDGDVEGEVRLVGGQIAADQPSLPDGSDPVELLLEMRQGRFEVFQKLPPLAVSRGDDLVRTGSLDVHVPADLMNYCEHSGLTGVLILSSDGKSAEVVYDKGELGSIKLDGADELHQVFGWEEGTFRIEARTSEEVEAELTPEEVPAVRASDRPDSTSKHFLKVVEVTLSDILREREEHRPPTRTAPPLPAMEPHKHETLPPPTKKEPRNDQTVRVIYLGAAARRTEPEPAAKPPGVTRHVQAGAPAEDRLPDAVPERRSDADDPRPPARGAGASSNATAKPRDLPGFAWAVVTLVVAVLALYVLSLLPPLE